MCMRIFLIPVQTVDGKTTLIYIYRDYRSLLLDVVTRANADCKTNWSSHSLHIKFRQQSLRMNFNCSFIKTCVYFVLLQNSSACWCGWTLSGRTKQCPDYPFQVSENNNKPCQRKNMLDFIVYTCSAISGPNRAWTLYDAYSVHESR